MTQPQTIRPSDMARAAAQLALAAAQPLAGSLSRITGRGVPIDERSRRNQGLVTPADGAFAIWGPIFLANAAQAVRAAAAAGSADPRRRRAEWLAAGAYAGNTAWSLQAQLKGLGWPSLAIISASAGAAVAGFLEAQKSGDRWTTRALAPLAGWLTVAVFANAEQTLNETQGRPERPAETARGLGLATGAALAAGSVAWVGRGAPLYAGAAGWGLAGIARRNLREGSAAMAATAALGLAGLVAVTLLARRRSPH